MKAYLTEWLIRHGTGWVDYYVHHDDELWVLARTLEYIEHEYIGINPQERITPKGLEYIKDEKQT